MEIQSIRDGGTVQIGDDLFIDHRINTPTPYAVYSPKYPNSLTVQPISTEKELRAVDVVLFQASQECEYCNEGVTGVISRARLWIKIKLEELLEEDK